MCVLVFVIAFWINIISVLEMAHITYFGRDLAIERRKEIYIKSNRYLIKENTGGKILFTLLTRMCFCMNSSLFNQ